MSKTVELSVDIAMRNLGWVLFEGGAPVHCGVIKPEVPKDQLSLKGKQKLTVRDQNVILIEQLATGFDRLLVEFRPARVVGEATPGGAKDASAAVKMNMALSAVVTALIIRGVQYQWCTPNEVKLASVGFSTASKEQIVDWAIRRYGGEKHVKEVMIKNGKRAGQIDCRLTYQFLGTRVPGGTFEHIADACGAYEAVRAQASGKTGAKGYRNKPKRLGK